MLAAMPMRLVGACQLNENFNLVRLHYEQRVEKVFE